MKRIETIIILYTLFSFALVVYAIKSQRANYEISDIPKLVERIWLTPTPTPSLTPTPTPSPTPQPTPKEALTSEELDPQEFYEACLYRGMIEPPWEEGAITKERGGCMGPSGRETYYNLKMDLCVWYMRELGYDEEEYPYWIRDDGAKMLGNYVMCAANWAIRPKGTILETSLGTAIVVDTGDFVADFPYGIDLAVNW